MNPDAIIQFEIDAYTDGELNLARRLAVETHLAHCPGAAAAVMAERRTRTALEIAHAGLVPPGRSLVAAAQQLGPTIGRETVGARWRRVRPALAAVAAAAITTIALVAVTPPVAEAGPPSYVGDALMAFHTGVIRAAMPSQPESPVFDARDIQRSTRIRVPKLPDGWQVTDVQIFPSNEGPALQIMAQTNSEKTVSIFAVRSSAIAPSRPIAVRRGGTSVAYWRNGDIAYALTGAETPQALDIAAEDLADNRLD